MEIFSYLRSNEKETFKGLVSTLAGQRKLRPVFILKKTPDEQIAWLCKTAHLKFADGVDEHALQIWLLNRHPELLISFLDSMGIEHDGKGSVDKLPDALDGEQLKKTAEQLLESNPEEVVKVYLHVFQLQQPGGWPTLGHLLENDSRLCFASEQTPA